MFDIQRDMPLNSLASYLNSIDFFFVLISQVVPLNCAKDSLNSHSESMATVPYVFPVSIHVQITNYLSVHTDGEEVKLDKITACLSLPSFIPRIRASSAISKSTLPPINWRKTPLCISFFFFVICTAFPTTLPSPLSLLRKSSYLLVYFILSL